MGNEWFALCIPAACCLVMFLFFKRQIVWWELAVPTTAAAIFILVFKWAAYNYSISDTEYRGSVIVSARYYEYWETYVHRTCTRTVSCGKNCTTVQVYDCSYCDHNPAQWIAVDNYGRQFPITEDYYNELHTRWRATPQFIELNRSINYHGGCGRDGDAYDLIWNQDPATADAAVTEHEYKNYVQASHSAFKMPYISQKEAREAGLYDYPQLYWPYKQDAILGLDSVKIGQSAKDSIALLYEYFNGYYGSVSHVKTFLLLFPAQPLDVSYKQEYYWDGGNDNELVIAVGFDRQTNNITWVRAFGWADDRRVFVDVREDLMELGHLDLRRFIPIIGSAIERHWKPKDFQDFSYLHVDLTTNQVVWLYIITLLVSVGASIYCIANQFAPE